MKYIGWSSMKKLIHWYTWFYYSWGHKGGLIGSIYGFRLFGFEFEGRNGRYDDE